MYGMMCSENTSVKECADTLPVLNGDDSFSAAVAGFGMLLRDSKFKGDITYNSLIELAKDAKGIDDFGYRAEFIQLIEKAELIEVIEK